MSREVNWKTIEMRAQYEQVAINFVDLLHQRQFLKLNYVDDRIELENIIKIMERINHTGLSFNKLFEIVSTTKINDFSVTMKSYNFSSTDIMLIFTGLFVHLMLEQFELLKKLILILMEKKDFEYNERQREISGNETLGTLLEKLDMLILVNPIKENVNNKLRNALAHGYWWASNETFYYRTNSQNIETYQIAELLIENIKLKNFVEVFYEAGYKHANEIRRSINPQ